MLTWLRRILVGLAALAALAFGGLLVLEESGLLTRVVRNRLARELGEVGAGLTLEHVALAWFEPGLELRGLRLTTGGAPGTPDLELRHLHLTFSPRLERLDGVRVEGGRVLLGARLFDAWNRLANQRAERAGQGPPATPPAGSVRGLEVALELYDGKHFELGAVDLCARPGPDGGIELAGRLAPSLGGAITSPVPIRINGAVTPERARLWASARDLALETRALPANALARPLPLSEGSARLTLDSSFELEFADAARPRGHLRASLREGKLLVRPDVPRVEDLAIELEAALEPPPGADPWGRDSWDARASVRGRLGATPLWAWSEFGRNLPAGQWLKAWGEAREVSVEPEALAALGLEPRVAFAREMLQPHGHVDLDASVAIGREDGNWTHDAAARVRAASGFTLAYHGLPGEAESGFPVPFAHLGGELLAASRTEGDRPWRLAGLGLSAEESEGRLDGWLQVTAPSRSASPAFPLPELDLVISSPSLALVPALRAGLEQNHYLRWIGPAFSPENGTLAGDFRLRTGPELGGTSGQGSLRLRGVSLRWSEVPVPLDNVEGRLDLLWEREVSVARDQPLLHRRPIGVAYVFDNRGGPRVGAQARVEGWVRELPCPPVFDPAVPPPEALQELRVEIDELGLRGRDFDLLSARFPALEREVQEYGAVGRTRVHYRGVQLAPGAPFLSEIEATPIEVHVRPQFFQRQTRDLHGRILIQSEDGEAGQENAAQFVLAGTWPGGVELFGQGQIPATGEAHVQVLGAGIDPSNTSFKGALITSLAEGNPASGGVDLSSWTLAGRVDFALQTSFDPLDPAPPRNRYRFQLRNNDFHSTDLVLRDLHGTFTQEDDLLSSPLVEATLGGHPLELRNVLTFPLAILPRVPGADPLLAREGFWKDPTGRAMQAEVVTRDLPLDAEHLVGLLEPAVLENLRQNPSWRGELDVLGARLLVTREERNQGKVALRGSMQAHDIALRLGLPIRIDTAHVALQESIVEGGRFRGWASIDGLEATIAERRLSDASMIAGYVDGRLTIDNLSGEFEGGRLESLGGALGGASKALGVDLAEPHRFDVAVRLNGVGVGGLLRGVFQSSIADEGVLDASLQLSGTPGEVLALTGRGALSLDEGALWSIPVMRELFQQLGFDKGGLFDRLRSRFELRDGRLKVSHLEIRSSLLDLVGEGWQDLDGRLSYDLEVRYGLVDRLGLFGRVLYWLNNSLMRVAVRGDFDRPVVKIRNSILELLSGFDSNPPRRLPMPGFSALGARF